MAKQTAPVARSPWEDRWTQPTLEQLIEPYRDNMLKVVQALLEGLAQYEDIQQDIVWHGDSWRWTLEYQLHPQDGEPGVFCYLVPRPEGILIAIPLAEDVVNRLPIRRLNRVIRDGIRSAKRAVDITWAMWTPTAQTEVEHLMDLVKRNRKLTLNPE